MWEISAADIRASGNIAGIFLSQVFLNTNCLLCRDGESICVGGRDECKKRSVSILRIYFLNIYIFYIQTKQFTLFVMKKFNRGCLKIYYIGISVTS